MFAKQNEKDKPGTLTFMDEVRQQPVVLRQFIDQAYSEKELQHTLEKLLRDKKHPYIIFTGMGSSLFACYIAMKFLQRKGIQALTVEALELQKKPESFFSEDMVVVAVSQSGESPEVIDLLKTLPPKVMAIAVTNYPKSQLYRMTKLSFQIYAGTEYFTSTKTYTNTLAAMLLLAYRIAGCSEEECEQLRSQMEQCSIKMEKMIEDENLGKEVAAFISDIKFLICIGSGYSYTSACHSEIVAEEAGKFYSSRYTPAQFIHGPIELIQPGFGTIIYDFDAQYHAKCDDVRANVLRYGGKVLLITNRSDVAQQENQMVCVIEHEDPITSILLEIIPLELGIDSLCKERGVATGHLSRVVKRIVN